jgi:OOP family OmpA-OmpF porin
VTDGLSHPPSQNPYLWRASLEGGVLTLSGGAPSPADRAAIVAAAQKAMPQARVVDQMNFFSGAPSAFAEKAEGGLRVLTHLTSGEAQLRGAELSVSGQAATSSEYKEALALAHGQPAGVTLAKEAIVAPKAAAFGLQAENDGKTLALTGFIGSEAERAAILAQAKKLFPDLGLIDKLQIASGAPPKFAANANAALRALAQLKTGKASLLDNVTTLKGQAPAGKDAMSIAAALGATPGLTLDLKGVAAGDISPYLAGAEKAVGALTLSGFYPDEETHDKILGAAKEKFGGLAINDRMQRGAGAPAGFLAATLAGLDQLANLRTGQFSLRDRAITLAGDAIKADAADAMKAAFVAAAPATFVAETKLFGEAPASPAQDVAAATAASAPAAVPTPAAGSDSSGAPQTLASAPASGAATAPPLAGKDCQDKLSEIVRTTPILFRTASSRLRPESIAVLDALVSTAKQCPAASFEIAGHTDDIGQPSQNRLLSLQRAWAVASYLVKAGIEEGRLSAVGFGDAKPLAPNDTEDNRAKNRRIEFNLK